MTVQLFFVFFIESLIFTANSDYDGSNLKII